MRRGHPVVMVPSALGTRPDQEVWPPLSQPGISVSATENRPPAIFIRWRMSKYGRAPLGAALLFLVVASCGGGRDICDCTPLTPVSQQYRSAAKHVPLPKVTPQEITVATMLQWPQGPNPAFRDRRSGRELQLFHIKKAFLQNMGLDKEDCDLHYSISETADKNAPRAIVETPIDSEYCASRHIIQSQLAQHGLRLDANHGGELATPLPVQVLGLAFHDFNHDRPVPFATTWELHPAIVTLLP